MPSKNPRPADSTWLKGLRAGADVVVCDEDGRVAVVAAKVARSAPSGCIVLDNGDVYGPDGVLLTTSGDAGPPRAGRCLRKPQPQLEFTRAELEEMLPAVLSDLKHHTEPTRRQRSNVNIRRDMYHRVILVMGEAHRFYAEEALPSGGTGQFIKGFVRDVWSYLEQAYDLVHGIDYEQDYAELIRTVI